MAEGAFSTIAVEFDGPVGIITLNRPDKLNAFTVDMARELADALVVSGPATGAATPLDDLQRVRRAVPGVPLLVGSGVTPESAPDLLAMADGLIVGTYVKQDGDVRRPVDRARVEKLVAAARRR